MNKKGMIFMPMIAIVLLGVLAYGLLQIQESKIGETAYLGEKQGNLIKIYDSGERALFYTEQAAKLANLNALKKLGANGGFYEVKEECKYKDYVLWSSDCLPYYEKEFFKHFNDGLNDYFMVYPAEKIIYYKGLFFNERAVSVSVLKDQNINNYEIEIEKGISDYNVMGKAKKKLELFGYETKYSIEPSFKLNVKYDLGVYEKLRSLVANNKFIDCLKKENINDCKSYFSGIGEVEFKKDTELGNYLKYFRRGNGRV